MIELTKHAANKISQREIPIENIKAVISNPEWTEPDRIDNSLTHYIGLIEGRFLRVICKEKVENDKLVIIAFFDRRLMRRKKNDKD